jgi:predicted PurR-regulated permease PerM
VLLAFVAVKLWPLFKLLIVSILLAVPMYRLVLWACRRGWPRWAGILLASLALLVGVVGFGALVGPVVFSQASNLGKNLPKLKEELARRVPAGPMRDVVQQATDFTNNDNFKLLAENGITAAKATAGGLLDFVLIMALTIYLIVDGPRALEWLIAYFPREQRQRVSKGLDKIGDRVVRYIIGQCIVSGLFASYVLIVLSILHVPMALLLAVVAGILDVAPVIGISITLVLGGTIGMTVSSDTALLVIALLGAYHGLENYFIIPKVYGKQLRLSTLAVLLSMIAGGMVAGVIGAVAILPVVAAYPALESLWLSRQLEPEVVKDHQEQLRAA